MMEEDHCRVLVHNAPSPRCCSTDEAKPVVITSRESTANMRNLSLILCFHAYIGVVH